MHFAYWFLQKYIGATVIAFAKLRCSATFTTHRTPRAQHELAVRAQLEQPLLPQNKTPK